MLPLGLAWDVEPAAWRVDGEALVVTAAARTDHFVDPGGGEPSWNAARALALAPSGQWQLSARVSVDFTDDFDAGVLLLWSDERHFAKLCFERSPRGEPMVVSVVTRDVSDDANAWVVDADTVWLRISNLAEHRYAFHAGADGTHWDFVRHFTLGGGAPMRYGLSAQAPVGAGCTVTFTDLSWSPTAPTDLRDGS